MRSTLLRGTPYCTEEEERCLDDAENLLRTQLAGLFGADMLDHVTSECDIARLHSTVKLELAFLLRHQIAATVETMDRVPTKDPSIQESGPVCTIAAPDFAIVRSYLEDFGDLSILADIIGLVATSLDSRVLTSASDTLLYHEMSFRAIGAFEPLFGKIAMRYAAIRTIRSPEREFLVSLADLCVAANAENHLFQAIAQDLSFCEQKNSIAACSPASDTAADVGPSRVNSDEDIERVLASGTTMDRQVMTRVFDKILANLEDQIQKGSTPSGNHSVWFCRLRAFDESAFENILDDRLTILLTNHRTTLSRAVLPALVTSRCVTLDHLLKIAKDCVSKRKAISEEDALAVSMDVIDALLPSEQLGQLCSPHEAYRYRLKQWKYLHDTGTSMLQLIAQTLELGAVTLPQNSQEQLNRLLTNERVHGVVRHFVLKDVQLLCSILGIGTRSYSDATQRSFRNMVEKLLDPSNELCESHHASILPSIAHEELALPQKNIEQQIKTVVQAADHLSLSFCQLEIRILFSVGAHDSERLPDNIPGAFLEALNSSAQSDGAPCLGLVSGLETDLATKVRPTLPSNLPYMFAYTF